MPTCAGRRGRKLQVCAANMLRWAAGRRTFAQRLRGWLDSPFGEVGRVNGFNGSPLSGGKSRSPSPFGHRLLPEGPRSRIRSVLHQSPLRGRPICIADANADLEKWPLRHVDLVMHFRLICIAARCIAASPPGFRRRPAPWSTLVDKVDKVDKVGGVGFSIRFGVFFYLIHVLACIRCITAVL